jgi:hypothetical protein
LLSKEPIRSATEAERQAQQDRFGDQRIDIDVTWSTLLLTYGNPASIAKDEFGLVEIEKEGVMEAR